MGYCYAHKVSAAESQIITDLRQELYTLPYATIDWPAQRNNIAPGDVYTPHSRILDVTLSTCVSLIVRQKSLYTVYIEGTVLHSKDMIDLPNNDLLTPLLFQKFYCVI